MKIFFNIYEKITTKATWKTAIFIALLLSALGLSAFFNTGLALGLMLNIFLIALLFFVLFKIGIKDNELCWIILITSFVHFLSAVFLHYGEFSPFGGGSDAGMYQAFASELSARFRDLNFSLAGLRITHFYPIFLGIIYTLTSAKPIIGELQSVWLAALSVTFVYLLVLELGGSKKSAFFAGLIANIYPSYLYFGSLALKDTISLPLTLIGIYLIIKIIKNFSWVKFLIFFIVLTALINLRFYIGMPLMISFAIFWFLLSDMRLGKRIICGIIFIAIMGLSTQISGLGYYGIDRVLYFLNPNVIVSYRVKLYSEPKTPVLEPTPTQGETIVFEEEQANGIQGVPVKKPENKQASFSQIIKKFFIDARSWARNLLKTNPNKDSGTGSTFLVNPDFKNPFSFALNYAKVFIYSLLGPFPWQLKNRGQLFSLAETFPWYFLFYMILRGMYERLKKEGFYGFVKKYKFIFPVLASALISIAGFSLFVANFGIIVRIRIPALVTLFCLGWLAFDLKINYFSFNFGFKNISKKIKVFFAEVLQEA